MAAEEDGLTIVLSRPVERKVVSDWQDLLGALRRVALSHPSKTVPEKAKALELSIFNSGAEAADFDDSQKLTAWRSELDTLVEAMHLAVSGH